MSNRELAYGSRLMMRSSVRAVSWEFHQSRRIDEKQISK
jgi:hypothetical protein